MAIMVCTGHIFANGIEIATLSKSVSLFEFNISMSDFYIDYINVDGDDYAYIDFDGANHVSVFGYPAYPFMAKMFILPSGASATLVVNEINWEIFDDITIIPADLMYGESVGYLDIHEEFPWSPGVFLGEPIELGSYIVVGMYVVPFANRDGNLYSLANCSVSLAFDSLESFSVPIALDEIGDKSFENYSLIRHFIDYEESDNDYDYLVIYSHDPLSEEAPPYNLTEYKDALEPLMEYRESLGFDIHWHYVAPTSCYSTCIQDAIDYYLANNNIRYIILLGDLIPSCYMTVSIPFEGDHTYYSDSYYLYDYRGALPAYGIGRFPGGPNEIEILVEKTLAYEEYTPSTFGEFHFNDIVLLAHEDPNGVFKDNCENVASWSYSCDLDFTKFYRDNGPVSPASIYSAIESNVGAVSYRGHGWIWSYSWNVPGFQYNSEIQGLSNEFYPVVFNLACRTGDYVGQFCNAEAWLKDTNGGACAVWAADEDTYPVPNNCLHELIYAYTYDNNYPRVPPSVARMALYASYYTVYLYQGSSYAWANFFEYKWFGDPGLRLWTNESAPGRLGYSPIPSLSSVSSSLTAQSSAYPALVTESFSLHPNPATSSVVFRVASIENADTRICIYDLNGRSVEVLELNAVTAGMHEIAWEISEDISCGVYIAHITTNDGSVMSKMLTIIR